MTEEMETTTTTEPVVEEPVEETPVSDPETITPEEPETVEDPAPPMEVVSVDELLERVAAADAAQTEGEDPAEGDPEEVTEEEVTEEPEVYTEVLEVVQDDTHYFLTTDFADYTVTEGLLLVIIIAMFLKWIGGSIKEGFYWLW